MGEKSIDYCLSNFDNEEKERKRGVFKVLKEKVHL